MANQETIQQRFLTFHFNNPHIYSLLCKYARLAKAKGFAKYSIQSLCEIIRWHVSTPSRGDEFKVNNSYLSRYARLLMSQESDLAGFFEVRELVSQ
jgi:hypothetical protein